MKSLLNRIRLAVLSRVLPVRSPAPRAIDLAIVVATYHAVSEMPDWID